MLFNKDIFFSLIFDLLQISWMCRDQGGVTVLHLCTRHPDKKGLQFLIKHFGIGATSNPNSDDDDGEGGGIDVQDRNKRTPLHWAASQVSNRGNDKF